MPSLKESINRFPAWCAHAGALIWLNSVEKKWHKHAPIWRVVLPFNRAGASFDLNPAVDDGFGQNRNGC